MRKNQWIFWCKWNKSCSIYFNILTELEHWTNDWRGRGVSPHGEVNHATASHAQVKYKLTGVRRDHPCIYPLPEVCHVTCCWARQDACFTYCVNTQMVVSWWNFQWNSYHHHSVQTVFFCTLLQHAQQLCDAVTLWPTFNGIGPKSEVWNNIVHCRHDAVSSQVQKSFLKPTLSSTG